MPRIAIAFLAAIWVLGTPSTNLAHGGGLDKYGCHHDRKRGGYHCHRGPCAGQSSESQRAMLTAPCSNK